MLEVTPATLRACAERGRTTGAAVSALAGPAADACDRAAGPHHAWRFGAALAALAPRWRRQLTGQGTAVTGDAAKLDAAATTYATAESGNVDLVRRVCLPAAGRGAW